MRYLLALPLLLTTAAVQAIPFAELDANADGAISKEEFVNSALFERWDNDNDGQISADELNSDLALLTAWDRDGGGGLDRREFGDGVWSQVDRDADGILQQGEYADDAGWFEH